MSSRPRQPPARLPTLTEVIPVQALERTLSTSPVDQQTRQVTQPSAHALAEALAQALRPWADSIVDARLPDLPTSGADSGLQGLVDHLHASLDPILREAASQALGLGAIARR